MPEDMSSWKYLQSAGSRFSSFRGYLKEQKDLRTPLATPRVIHGSSSVQPGEERQTWRAWAGQKIKRNKGDGEHNVNNETVNLFPGWAARRYPKSLLSTPLNTADGEPKPFEVEVFVSGYAISYRSPDNASRSQRAFIRLAKGFASLPKLIAVDASTNSVSRPTTLSRSTEELLSHINLPPKPTEITEDFEVEALERQLKFAKVSNENEFESPPGSPSSSRSSSVDSMDIPDTDPNATLRPVRMTPSILEPNSTPADVIRRLHANLESRLQPFWSSVLPSRTVRLHLFVSPHFTGTDSTATSEILEELRQNKDNFSFSDSKSRDNKSTHSPLASSDVVTAPDGSFQARFRINWDELCHHPLALHIAFGEPVEEHDIFVVAQLMPPPPPPPTKVSYETYMSSRSSAPSNVPVPKPTPKPNTTALRIPITHSPIRVISDIDDTIKRSNILSGARAVFYNVFVKELNENVIPGMGEWYSWMWKSGVRFHYVSNGPFELLPILNEFFQISQLPPGSIKLKSYAGRSLFNGLLSAPAARKRAGVIDVLDSFPDSRFFLIGDTGEQDLELYADISRERSEQILGVFVRDVGAAEVGPLADPTGWKAVGAAGTRSASQPLLPATESATEFTPSSSPVSPRPKRTLSSSVMSVRDSISGKIKIPAPLKMTSAENNSRNDYFTSMPLSAEPDDWTPGSTTPMPPATSSPTRSYITQPPLPTPPPTLHPPPSTPGGASLRSSNTQSSLNSIGSGSGRASMMTDAEKKRYELQMRVYRARTQMPGHVPLRIFREPAECVEVEEIMKREGLSDRVGS